MDFYFFCFACAGITAILTKSKLLEKIRPKHYFFHCPMCVGFWVGLLVWFLGSNVNTELFNFNNNLMTGVFLGFVSSITSWLLIILAIDLEGE